MSGFHFVQWFDCCFPGEPQPSDHSRCRHQGRITQWRLRQRRSLSRSPHCFWIGNNQELGFWIVQELAAGWRIHELHSGQRTYTLCCPGIRRFSEQVIQNRRWTITYISDHKRCIRYWYWILDRLCVQLSLQALGGWENCSQTQVGVGHQNSGHQGSGTSSSGLLQIRTWQWFVLSRSQGGVTWNCSALTVHC